jgi:hypothetical protein
MGPLRAYRVEPAMNAIVQGFNYGLAIGLMGGFSVGTVVGYNIPRIATLARAIADYRSKI